MIDLTLRCPVCGDRADMCFAHGDDWKKRVHSLVEPREGMVTVYDSRGEYVGCMGIETWRGLLADEAANTSSARTER